MCALAPEGRHSKPSRAPPRFSSRRGARPRAEHLEFGRLRGRGVACASYRPALEIENSCARAEDPNVTRAVVKSRSQSWSRRRVRARRRDILSQVDEVDEPSYRLRISEAICTLAHGSRPGRKQNLHARCRRDRRACVPGLGRLDAQRWRCAGNASRHEEHRPKRREKGAVHAVILRRTRSSSVIRGITEVSARHGFLLPGLRPSASLTLGRSVSSRSRGPRR